LGPGRCLRLWGRAAPLEAHTPPEVLREELTDLLLAAAAAGTPVAGLDFPDPLPDHGVQRASERLRGMCALNESGTLSEHGARIAPLSLDPLFAHLITAMADETSRAAMVDLAAALSVGRSLLRPLRDESAQRALKEWQPLACDATTLIKVLRETPPPEIPIDPASRKEARRIARHTRRALALPEVREGEPWQRERLLEQIAGAAPELLFVRRVKRREALGNGRDEVTVGRESRFAEDGEAAIVLDQHSLPGRGTRQTLSFATCMAPVPLALLERLELGKVQIGQIEWHNPSGTLKVGMERHYAGRKVGESFREPSGAVARRALARLILDNRLLKGTGAQLREDVAAWNLYLALGLGEGQPAEPADWLEGRLAELGVEGGEDMLLIEAQDLAFAGIPDWQRADFDERHPRELFLSNMHVAVRYEAGPKKVTLERIGGIRKDPPKGWEIPAWSGWRVFFQDASRVIRVR
jgi:ATP-dependent helicase HrpB